MNGPANGPANGSVADGVRLAVGTLTVLPVRPPRVLDRRTASWAMTLAPLVGTLIAVPSALVLSGFGERAPLVAATIAIALLALLTRAMHLDGLADTADGLGSGRPGVEALAIMRKGDIGPFGVVTLVLVLMVQVVALAQLVTDGQTSFALVLALVVSRLILPLLCVKGVPAARTDGLGHVVVGSVGRGQAVLASGLAGAVLWGLAALPPGQDASPWPVAALAVFVALAVGAALCWWAVRRLGGVTGDVLGACVEATFTAALLVLALA
ncbi:MAG: adenosylcobinamide-GDP ribazoletransferase [Nocardioidaceae bacterium]